MKLSPFLFLAILCVFILPVSAISVNIDQPTGVSLYVASNGVSYNPNDVAVCVDLYNISVFNADFGYASYQSVYIGKTDEYLIDCLFSEDYIYLAYADGEIYRVPNSYGVIYWDSLEPSEQQLLTTVGTSAKLNWGNDGDLYISSSAGIRKIDMETLTVTNGADLGVHTSINFDNKNMYCGLSYTTAANNDFQYAKFSDLQTSTKITYNATSSFSAGAHSIMAFIPLYNGEYFVYMFGGNNELSNTGNYHTGNTVISPLNPAVSVLYNDAVVTSDGIAFITSFGDDKIETYFIGVGAYNFGSSDNTYSLPEITYNVKKVDSEYSNYYNKSNVNIIWTLSIDDDFIDEYNNVYSEKITNRYNWRIEIFSPDDILVNSYNLPDTWKYQQYTLGIFGTGDYINSGSADFGLLYGNGTWTIKLYEINKITGAKAFLTSGEFEIMNQTNPYSYDTPIDNNPTNIVSNFLESPYLIAIIIIGVVGFQFGRGKDGNINGSAMVVLIPLAVGLCALMGILPMWILYVMVLCIIAFVAIKMSSGGS